VGDSADINAWMVEIRYFQYICFGLKGE
jgi:hypothetical protein